jgi:hypothetical protein
MLRSPLTIATLGIFALASRYAGAATPSDMPANSWLAIPESKLEAVRWPSDPALEGNGFWTIIGAWSGAVLDTTRLRLAIWGGGHNDYYGNEMYAFDIAALTWSRLTDPTIEWNNCGDPNADGTANARHTYNGMAYIAHADRMFVSGGALNCTSGACGGAITWAFDFDTTTWTDRQPTGMHSTGCENTSAYDAASGRVYFGDAGGLYSYSYDDNAWTQHNQDSLYGVTSAIDTTRGLLVMLGNGEVRAYDIGAGDFTAQIWQTQGGDALLNGSTPGFDYDPVTDRLVGWNGGPVYVLDPDAKTWTTYDPPGAPAPTDNGIFGRWRYVPDVNAFILVTATDVDVHFFKLSDGGMLPPPGTGGSGGASAASTAASVGAGGAPPSATPEGTDDGGCGCRTPRSRTSGGAFLWLLATALLWRRRLRDHAKPRVPRSLSM